MSVYPNYNYIDIYDCLNRSVEDEISEEVFQAQIEEIIRNNQSSHVNAISPMQLMSRMSEDLSKQSNLFGQLFYIKGIFKCGNNVQYNQYYYDNLKDENTPTQVKILVPAILRQRIKPDSLMIFCGMLTKRIDSYKSSFELHFRVDSIVEEVKSSVLDEDDRKRIKLRQKKVAAGFKNVDNLLESLLLNDTRPKIALLFAQSAIVLGDFENGKRAASSAIDFVEEREVFTRTNQLCAKLRALDQQGYSAIALVRGGGIDPMTDVDKPEVIETVVDMKTPFISGLGHQPERIFLRQVADKWTPNPQALGQYFSELVEQVAIKRNNSRAILEASVKKQYQGQLDTEKRRNIDLQNQIKQLTRTYEANQARLKETHRESIDILKAQLYAKKRNVFWGYVVVVFIALVVGFALAFIIQSRFPNLHI